MRSLERDDAARAVDAARALRYRIDRTCISALAALTVLLAALRALASTDAHATASIRLAGATALGVTLVRRTLATRRDCDSVVVASELSLAEPTLALTQFVALRWLLVAALARAYAPLVYLALSTLGVSIGFVCAHYQSPLLARYGSIGSAALLAWPPRELDSLLVELARLALLMGAHLFMLARVEGRVRDDRVAQLGVAHIERVERVAVELSEAHVAKLAWIAYAYAPLLVVGVPAVLALDYASSARAIRAVPTTV